MSYTRFLPNVCNCVVMINNDDHSISFESKCDVHASLNDSDAFTSIQSMCAEAQETEETPE